MIVVLKMVRALYNAFAGTGDPVHVWFAFVLGLLAACLPLGTTEPLTYLVLFLVLATRAGIFLFLTAFALVKVPMLLGGWRAVDALGVLALESVNGLRPLWTKLLNLPGVALLGFDRYQALGGVIAALVGGALLFVPITRGLAWFRTRYVERLNQYRLVRWLRGFWFVRAIGFVVSD